LLQAGWVAKYDGPANQADRATAIILDGAGNVYVTGQSVGIGTGKDYATVVYSSSGAELAVARYDGPETNSYDNESGLPLNYEGAVGIGLDDLGNIYVAGTHLDFTSSATSYDYGIVKYGAVAILPIELLSFTATPVPTPNPDGFRRENNVYVLTEWTTASETNNDHFTVERLSAEALAKAGSLDAVNWEMVGIVKGAGNSSTPRSYSLTDENPREAFPLNKGGQGVVYYRLKQTDYDGHFEYSDIVVVS